VVTVIVVVPAVNGVTTPLATVATAGALEDQFTLWLAASAGATVATNVPVAPPAVKVMVAGSKVTPVTATGVTMPQPLSINNPRMKGKQNKKNNFFFNICSLLIIKYIFENIIFFYGHPSFLF
jgi:hypothetical protein